MAGRLTVLHILSSGEIVSGRVTHCYCLYYTRLRMTTHFSVLWKGNPRLDRVLSQHLHTPRSVIDLRMCIYSSKRYILAYIHKAYLYDIDRETVRPWN